MFHHHNNRTQSDSISRASAFFVLPNKILHAGKVRSKILSLEFKNDEVHSQQRLRSMTSNSLVDHCIMPSLQTAVFQLLQLSLQALQRQTITWLGSL